MIAVNSDTAATETVKPKYLFIFLFLWLSVCFYMFQMIYGEAREKAIEELNARQMIHARQAKMTIEAFFSNIRAVLENLSHSDHIINFDDQGHQEMDFVLKLFPDAITAVTRLDPAGRIGYTTPFAKELTGKDISAQKHIQRILETRKPVVSDVFTAVEGYRAIAMHVPVFEDHDFQGTIGVLIDYRFISKRYLEDIRIGETGYAWLISREGIELYCPVPGHIDHSVYENCKDFPSILRMADEMLKGKQGVTTYEFDSIRDKKIEAIKKHAVYVPIHIADTFWSLVIASSEDEMLMTLEGFKNKLITLGAFLLFGAVIFSFYAMKVWGVVQERAERIKAEATLRQERDLMQRIIETSPAGITRTDANGMVVYANDHAERIFGIQLSEKSDYSCGDPRWQITDSEGNPFPDEKLPFNIVKETQQPVFDVQHCIQSPDGKRILLSINAMPLFGETGIFDGMVAAIDDITDKYLAEQNYKMLLNKMIDGFALHEIICDSQGRPVDYRFLAVNPAFEHLTGLKAEFLIGKSVLEVMPETECYWIEQYGRVALTGEPKFFENYSKELDRHFQVTAFRPAPHQFACIVVDISERKQAEKEIWMSKERFQKVFNSHLDAIFVLNAEVPASIIEVNFAATKIFGYPVDDMIGHSIEFLHVDESHRIAFQEKLLSAMQSEGRLAGFEFQMKRKDGTVFPTAHSVFELSDDEGKRTGWVSIVCDLTDRQQMEERLRQSQKMEAIGNLAGGIAHDFNNILFPILGISEMLLEDLPPGSLAHQNVKEIYTAGKRGSDLVKQILAFSRQNEHKMIPVGIQKILREVLKLCRRTIPADIEIDQDIQADCGLAMADPTQIHQVAMNLITNAYHAVEKSGGRISVRLHEADLTREANQGKKLEPGRYAIVSVSDTGCGIEPAHLDKIFEPYFTTKETGKGTGLGLAVVYGIIREHHGDITVQSQVDHGSTFRVYLPLIDNTLSAVAAEPIEIHPTGDESILLVDDEESIVRLVTQILERLGYRVTARHGSRDALNLFRSNPHHFDLVITDMTMPDMTGSQLAREMMAVRPDMPIVICTGFSERINKEQAQAIGVKSLLMKPIVKSEMAKVVRRVLDEASRQD